MTDRTVMSPQMQRVVAALLEIRSGEFGDGLYLDPAEMRVRAVGAVREERIAAACPDGTVRAPGPGVQTWESHVSVTYDCMEDWPGDITALLDGLLRGVLGQFATVGAVRAQIWEADSDTGPHDQRLCFRFKVRGERKEGA